MRQEIVDADHRDDGLDDDLVRFEPADLLAAIERELQRADAGSQRKEAEPVELQAVVRRRLVHQEQDAERREQAEWQVDQEHPVPGVGVGQVGAERRPHDRPDHHAHAEDGLRLRQLVAREQVDHHRLRERHQRRAEHALQAARHHHLLDVL